MTNSSATKPGPVPTPNLHYSHFVCLYFEKHSGEGNAQNTSKISEIHVAVLSVNELQLVTKSIIPIQQTPDAASKEAGACLQTALFFNLFLSILLFHWLVC